MTRRSSKGQIERLKELHPLLTSSTSAETGTKRAQQAPATGGGANAARNEGATLSARRWAARRREIDEAIAADRAAAGAERAQDVRRREEAYHNSVAVWAGLGIVVAIGLLGLFLVQHLIQESKLEDCLLAHRSNCDQLVDHR